MPHSLFKQKIRVFISFCVVVLLLASCATLISGSTQAVRVETRQVEGAACSLQNADGVEWQLPETPGVLTISKGKAPLTVKCRKSGYKDTTVTVADTFNRTMYGNTLNPAGYYVDQLSGASRNYPATIVVWMEPTWWRSLAEKNAFFDEKKAYEDSLLPPKKEEQPAGSSQAAPPAAARAHVANGL